MKIAFTRLYKSPHLRNTFENLDLFLFLRNLHADTKAKFITLFLTYIFSAFKFHKNLRMEVM